MCITRINHQEILPYLPDRQPDLQYANPAHKAGNWFPMPSLTRRLSHRRVLKKPFENLRILTPGIHCLKRTVEPDLTFGRAAVKQTYGRNGLQRIGFRIWIPCTKTFKALADRKARSN